MIFAKLLLPPTTGTAAAEHARQHRLRELERRKHEKHGLQSWREKWAKRVKKKKRLAKEADRVREAARRSGRWWYVVWWYGVCVW